MKLHITRTHDAPLAAGHKRAIPGEPLLGVQVTAIRIDRDAEMVGAMDWWRHLRSRMTPTATIEGMEDLL